MKTELWVIEACGRNGKTGVGLGGPTLNGDGSRCWLWLTGQGWRAGGHYLKPGNVTNRKSKSIDWYQERHGKMGSMS